jgi:hypothetical protein
MSSLEMSLNVTMARLRVIEEALHGQHEWSMRFVNPPTPTWQIEAQVHFSDRGVQFLTPVPAGIAYSTIELLMDDEVVLVCTDPHHSDHPYLYVWGLDLESFSSIT